MYLFILVLEIRNTKGVKLQYKRKCLPRGKKIVQENFYARIQGVWRDLTGFNNLEREAELYWLGFKADWYASMHGKARSSLGPVILL